MLLSDPHWLLLFMPLFWLAWYYRPLSRRLFVLRVLVIILVVFALAGLQLRLPGRAGTLVIVADRSLSMPGNSDQRISETMEMLKSGMPAGASLGLVTFGEEAAVEMAPARSAFSGFSATIGREASRLDEGLKRALSLIAGDLTGRVLIISDGLWTGNDPRNVAFQAAARGIPLDFRLAGRDLSGDVAITEFQVPALLNPGEAFIAGARVFSPVEQAGQVSLFASDRLIASFSRLLRPGENSLAFSLLAPEASVVRFRLQVNGQGPDPMPENNIAKAISEVVGQKPFLVVSDNTDSPMWQLLRQSGLAADLQAPGQISWSLEFLAGYSAVIIENVPAERVTMHGMQLLAAWVNHVGGGLLVTGGKNSYGNGGYYQSPLESVLPVSLELRSQHRKLALALMVVLDRSGSMAAPARGDRTKMDLANIAAASSLDLLSPFDEFGLLAVDTQAHEVVPLQRMTEKAKWRDRILRVESSGGGIYVFEGISKAAEMLLNAEAKTRHIILFADASDSEQPGRYWELLDKATRAGLTLSVIGLGSETDSDANLLRKIAEAGKGRIFFTRDPEELPRLFSQDTFVAARSTFIEEPAGLVSLPGAARFIENPGLISSEVGAYNLCYLRNEAFSALQTTDENKAPLLAGWQSGLGRVVCYMGVTGGPHAGKFAGDKAAAAILLGASRWIALDDRQSFGEMSVMQQIDNGNWKVSLLLDPERERDTLRENPEVRLIRLAEGQEPAQETLTLHWDSADSLQTETMVRGNEVISGLIRSGKQQKRLPPICQFYGPEFAPARFRDGQAELKELASVTGGREIIDLGQIWKSLPAKIQFRSLAEELLFLALLLFIIEVAERRTGFLTMLFAMLRKFAGERQRLAVPQAVTMPAAAVSSPVVGSDEKKIPENSIEKAILMTESPAAPSAPSPENSSQPGFSQALKTARKQADKRTRR
ncbi:MAG TPA: VWA domain-containing protein [Candidatus Ozemobacteraceae bacterium]|nr:VWA domain-containing protein [Candidatus Ozemobacteraceae bacterium]